MRTLCLALSLLFCAQASAEITITARRAMTVQTITPEIVTQLQTEDGTPIGESVREIGEPVTKPGQPAAVIQLKSDRDLNDRDNVLVRTKCPTADVLPIKPGYYLVGKPGKHSVTIIVLAQNPLSWDEETISVEVGPAPTPEPEPDPIPDTPADRFDNIGQRVAVWATGLPNRKAVAGLYRSHAKLLRADASQTINSAADSLMRALTAVPDIGKYTDLRKNLNADLNQRWNRDRLARVDLADYYCAIAIGLEAGQ